MVLGDLCTRDCRFCAVRGGTPHPPDPDEAGRIAEAVLRLGLKHCVITSVTRDDLLDGGAEHFAGVVRAIKGRTPAVVEVLTPDFLGSLEAVRVVLDSKPDIYNHNVETVPRLYPEVRPEADFERSLRLLRFVSSEGFLTKSGFMVGLGERRQEVVRLLRRLREAGCSIVTIGQYLRPSPEHHPVVRFVPPEEFEELRRTALEMGFTACSSGPFVRSSYNAYEVFSTIAGER